MIVDGLEINRWSRPVIEEVRSGGVDIVHATVATWEDLAGAMTRIGAFRHLCRHNTDIIRVVRSVDEMHEAKADGVLGVLLGFQNATMLGDDPEMVQIFADVGVRVIQLTYNIANHLGSSCYEPDDGGLTRLGRKMVSALNDAGVLIDISHVGNRTGLDALAVSDRPVAVTHGNPLWYVDSPRNKPDEVLDKVAEAGGIIGCTLYPLFMGGTGVSRSTYCEMVARLADQIGVEHVGIGTDAVLGWPEDGLGWMRSGRWDRPADATAVPEFPEWPSWFGGPKDFGSLEQGLDDVGFSTAERSAILGGNWLRLYREVFS